MKIGYYPGCSLEATAKEYDMSTREILKELDVELEELDDWNCCGASAAYSTDYMLSLALPARNIAIAEKAGLDVLAPCPECYVRLWKTNDAAKEDPKLLEKINKTFKGTDLEYKASVDIRHPVDIILNDVGLEKLKEKVKKPLTDLRVVPYYGCVLVRPPRKNSFDSAENPTSLDKIISTVGATPVDFPMKTKCCGAPLILADEDVMIKLADALFSKAKELGADCMITACPLCHMGLDGKQTSIEKAYDKKIDMPVLYFTQLIGLALGISHKKLGLDKNLVSTSKLVKSFSAAPK